MKNIFFFMSLFLVAFAQAQTWKSVKPSGSPNTYWMDICEVNNHTVAIGTEGKIALSDSKGAS